MDTKQLTTMLSLTRGPERLRVCLYGPTGSGKTARVRAAARELGLPVHVLLLQTMLPEDVLGLPKAVAGVTRWTLPAWAQQLRERPGVLFLDELDKPRPDVAAAVLTLVWELRLRDVQLHPETIVVCAMQPVVPAVWRHDETLKALAARLIFLPVGYREGYEFVARELNAPWALELAHKLDGGKAPELPVPEELSPRQLAEAIKLARAGFPAEILASGIVAEPLATWLAAKLAETASTELPADAAVELARQLPLEQLFERALDWAVHGPAEAWAEALVRIWTEGDEDLARRFMQAQYERCAEALSLCGDEPEEVVAEAFKRATRRIAEAYRARGQKAPQVTHPTTKKGGRQ
jgi:MoxR-like ATPase